MDSALTLMRQSTGLRLAVLFLCFAIGLTVTGVLAAAISSIPGIDGRTAALSASALQCILAFCLPAWCAGRFATDNGLMFLGLKTAAEPRAYAGVAIVWVLAMPAMNQIIDWNSSMHLPQWASGLEHTLREWEESNGAMAGRLLNMNGFWQMAVTVAVVGVLTGLGEEMFFRGGLQGILTRSGISAVTGVWIAAIVFSAMHFQFFGFVPRLLMGAFFGFVYLWTGSLWPAVFAHALNNSAVVVAAWLKPEGSVSAIETLGVAETGFPWAAAASAAMTAWFLIAYRREMFRHKPLS